MSKHPNDGKVTTKKTEFCKANGTSGMKEYRKSISHPSWLFMRLFMKATFFIYMHHPLWTMAYVLIVVMPAARYTAGISGRYRICLSLVSG